MSLFEIKMQYGCFQAFKKQDLLDKSTTQVFILYICLPIFL